MKRFACSALVLVGVVMLAMIQAANGAMTRVDDKVVGTRYQFTCVNGDKEVTSTFRVYKYEVFRKDKKVGTLKPKNDTETTLIITDFEMLNGTAALRKINNGPPKWMGDLKKTDGSIWKLTVVGVEK
jgi:hypothetical protein